MTVSATDWVKSIKQLESGLKTCQPQNKQIYINAINYAVRKLTELRANCGSMANAS